MKRAIKKIAILGSGLMGSRIACLFASLGLEVLLLDRPADPSPAAGHSAARNRLVNEALQAAVKSTPSPLFGRKALERIRTGNFEDHLSQIADADWILEAIVEQLTAKQQLFRQVELFRKAGSLVTSNTSGIPLQLLAEGRSADFQQHFCGSHFFNPPRYLPLLEIIPTAHTLPEIVDFLLSYGDRYLGKTTLRCKDTPAFIANRIGVYSMMHLLHEVERKGLSVEEVDRYTGPLLGRPKSATFRTADLVGLDTLALVARGLYEHCPEDEHREVFRLPAFMEKMLENQQLGVKSGQGFYKKIKQEDGSSLIWSLQLDSLEYAPQKEVPSPFPGGKTPESLKERLQYLLKAKGKAAELFRSSILSLFSYCSHRVPEISDALYPVDDAMKAGFGWELGPFELWDLLGLENCLPLMEQAGHAPAPWVYELIKVSEASPQNAASFYRTGKGERQYYAIAARKWLRVPGSGDEISLEILRPTQGVWSNAGFSIIDLGEGIVCGEFHSKMNTMGSEVIEGLNQLIAIAEKDFQGAVIGNQGKEFSVGANLALLLMYAVEQEWEEIDQMVRIFQQTMMRMRYSAVPVVAAPHSRALGGACELCLHADYVQAHAELYMGLVEMGAGIIPAGGGSKEFARRASGEFIAGGIDELEVLKNRYMTIAMAKVSTSAAEALELGYMDKSNSAISMNRRRHLEEARQKALEIARKGYTQPAPRKDIRVLGRRGLAMLTVGANNMLAGNFISEHDRKLSEKLAWVICGGDLSEPALVSESYLLDLEREAFLSLCGERKTQERMHHLLQYGKPLRN